MSNIEETKVDGRKERSNTSRKKVVDAFMALIQAGNVAPSAEEVAKKAQVGLRTVFRRFSEMELLYQELIEEFDKLIQPIVSKPFESGDWYEKVTEYRERKIAAFEQFMPFRLALLNATPKSQVIREQLLLWEGFEVKALKSILPFDYNKEQDLFNGLVTLLSYSSWIQLRNVQGLSVEDAAASRKVIMDLILKEFEARS